MEKNIRTRFAPSKTYREENFPVASMLIQKHLRPHVHTFYLFAREADDIADHIEISSEEKIKRLEVFDAVLSGKINDPFAAPRAYAHLQSTRKTGVGVEHARNLLEEYQI